ncbi:unnamed protein product [Bursaphelenchus xylophilus]|uniref:(pine wood nematode) hypothetical protein n=1 Tax=Bursaphelenchus xylophilus TaxID=6326 RepID=A0A1I7S525_BURXY|nr:unnamed protein product [Bursaphelenchus xylophilus]CAG9117630.1 unnamed protein product [Bursaphelenchus xylophilus]
MSDAPVVIITGATSGIGRATAVEMAKRKWRLVLTGRKAEAMNEVVEEAKKAGAADVSYILGSLNNLATPKKIVDHAISTFGQINSLVNNAGILVAGGLDQVRDDLVDYEQQMDTNVKAVIRLTRAALPHLIKTKGTVVNVSSICGTHAFSGILYYCMSKAALDQFTKCVALELAPKGVRVNSVNPGVILTEFQRRGGFTDDQYQEFLKKGEQQHPLGRVGRPEETAKAIAFLATDESSFTTGDLLKVDGGRALMGPS